MFPYNYLNRQNISITTFVRDSMRVVYFMRQNINRAWSYREVSERLGFDSIYCEFLLIYLTHRKVLIVTNMPPGYTSLLGNELYSWP